MIKNLKIKYNHNYKNLPTNKKLKKIEKNTIKTHYVLFKNVAFKL